jgi:hypothetical protein
MLELFRGDYMKNLKKNYFILIVTFILTLLITLYINSIIRDYKYIKVDVSPLEGSISQINLSELDIALSELNNGIIYVGNTHSRENKRLERDILKKIKNEDLENYVYYCDVSGDLDNNKYINILVNKFPNINRNLRVSPAFIYFKNGEAIEAIDSYNRQITSKDLLYLVQKYQIGK